MPHADEKTTVANFTPTELYNLIWTKKCQLRLVQASFIALEKRRNFPDNQSCKAAPSRGQAQTVACLLLRSAMSWGGWFGGGAPAAAQECIYPEIPTPNSPAEFQEVLEAKMKELLANVSNDGWSKLEYPAEPGSEGIELFEKPDTAGGVLSWVKVSAEMPCSAKRVMELVQSPDIALLKNWDTDVTKHEVVAHPAEHISVIYTNYQTPYPITHRAFVTARLRRTQPDSVETAVSQSINSKNYPVDPNFVRGVAFSGYVVTPVAGNPNASRYLRVTCVDPKGSIPVWVTNMFKTKAAKGTTALRNYIIAHPQQ